MPGKTGFCCGLQPKKKKDKRKASSPHLRNGSPNASLKDGEENSKSDRDKNENWKQRNGNISVVNTAVSSYGYKSGKCDFIPDYFYKTSGDKQQALVIENLSAKQGKDGGSKSDQHVENGVKQLPEEEVDMEEMKEEEVESQKAGFFHRQKIPSSSIFPQTSLTQRQSYMDDNYNSHLSRTTVSDLVLPDKPVQLSYTERSISVDSSPLTSPTSGVFSEQESKLTTLEEKQIAMEEMVQPVPTIKMATSISSKSLQSAVMTLPPKKDLPRGVDNSVNTIHDLAQDTEATMLLEELPSHAEEYNTSAKLPQHLNSIRTLSSKSITQSSDGVDNSISSITDADLSSSVLEFLAPEEETYQQQHQQLLQQQRTMPTPVTIQPTAETIHQKTLSEVDMVEPVKAESAVRASSTPVNLAVCEENEVECYVSMLAIAARVSEGYYINLNLSTSESNAPSTVHKFEDSLDENRNLSSHSESDLDTSDMEKTTLEENNEIAELYIEIDPSNIIERSEYHAPYLLERELTPDSLADVSYDSADSRNSKKQRSEFNFRIGGKANKNAADQTDARMQGNSQSDAEDSIDREVHSAAGTYTVQSNSPREATPSLEVSSENTLPQLEINSESFDMSNAVGLDSIQQQHTAESEISSISSGSIEYSRTQVTEAEELVETSVEETVTMVIKGVVLNPGSTDDEEEVVLSMQDAVDRGVLDLANGVYVNSTTKEKMSLIEAMNNGYIKMGPQTVQKHEEHVKSVGIITIRTTRETLPYTVKAVKDTLRNKMLTAEEARRLKILDDERGVYSDSKKKISMLIGDAVDLGLVEIEYDQDAEGTVEEEITKTYSVHAVVDQKEKTKLPFHDAVDRGLIDPDTGGYINNITGEKLTAEEAIEKGLIKATLVDNADKVSVDNMGSQVAERGVQAIRKKVLNPLKVLHSMKH